jgi:hypothetical protein
MPLLGVAGWFFGRAFEPRLDRVMERWNRFGVAGFTLAIFTILFWMVPRSVDGAVAYPGYEMFKFVSLPGAGAALALSFPRTHPLLAGVLKANVVSMLAVLAWVYTAASVRLCNSYLASDQKMLGAGMAVLAGMLAIYWGFGLLFGASGVRQGSDDDQLPARKCGADKSAEIGKPGVSGDDLAWDREVLAFRVARDAGQPAQCGDSAPCWPNAADGERGPIAETEIAEERSQ